MVRLTRNMSCTFHILKCNVGFAIICFKIRFFKTYLKASHLGKTVLKLNKKACYYAVTKWNCFAI